MKYDPQTYVNFSHFCFAITKNVEKCIRVSDATEKIIRVVALIALIFFHVGVVAFLALCALVFAGAVVYYGGIAALFAAHPYIAVALLAVMGAAGFGMGKSVREVYKNKDVLKVIKERVVSKYKAGFESSLTATHSTAEHIAPKHEQNVNMWVGQATIEVLAGLIKHTELGTKDILIAPLSIIVLSDLTGMSEAFQAGLGSDALDLFKEVFA